MNIKYFDVFNGDADGICALHQLRLDEPREAELISGPKRDIDLLRHLSGETAAVIQVLDISFDKNRGYVESLIETCKVCYIDHHYAGDIPTSENLEVHIDPDPNTCTSLIVDRLLQGRYRSWAVVGAFGDNLHDSARQAAQGLDLSSDDLEKLRELGELLNYNGYGASLSDLHFSPTELYEAVQQYKDPLDFFDKSPKLDKLKKGYDQDMGLARERKPYSEGSHGRIYRFPHESWGRRVAGVFSNEIAREMPEKAHALVVDNADGTHLVSVRAPLARKTGADELCRRFPTGGGRAAAAGINALPGNELDDFVKSFFEVFKP